MRFAEHVARRGEMKNAYKIFVAKAERKKQLGRHRRRREENIRMDLMEIEWQGMD
jgi:hypothetical protein